MDLHPAFKLYEESSEAQLALLDGTILGTNGARYKHLDTYEKIHACDNLLHLSLERGGKLQGNISFCRRQNSWYIRYFAFAESAQASGIEKSTKMRDGLLKRELKAFFESVFEGAYGPRIEAFYAYIDPKNVRSLWMSENFGFQTIGQIATQTFSRSRPKASKHLELLSDWNEIASLQARQFGKQNFYTPVQAQKGPWYVLKNSSGDIVAGARFYQAHWQFQRLPGKWGGVLTRCVPWIPGMRKIIRPADHRFLVPEGVFALNNDPDLLEQLFEGMLAAEKKNLLLWWVDEQDELYNSTRLKVKWGLLHRAVGVHHADVVCLRQDEAYAQLRERSTYTIGLDFI